MITKLIPLIILISGRVAIGVTAIQLVQLPRQLGNNQSSIQQGTDQIQFLDLNVPIPGAENYETVPNAPTRIKMVPFNITARIVEDSKNDTKVTIVVTTRRPSTLSYRGISPTGTSRPTTSAPPSPNSTPNPNAAVNSAYIHKETIITLFSIVSFVALTTNRRIIL